MADYRIICVRKADVTLPYRHGHITHAGTGTTTTTYTKLWTRQQVVEAIDGGTDTFHTIGNHSGKRAEVYTAKCGHCSSRIIRTTPDDARDNNLDNLSTCS